MKTLKLIALAAFALLFSQCKTTAPTAPAGPTPSLSEVLNILDTTESKFLQFADSTNGDPWKAIMLTAAWVRTQPTVQSAAAFDSTYIHIMLKSGLMTTFSIDQIGADSLSIFKGGGGSPHQSPELSHLDILSKNTITNKKVLIYSPVTNNFWHPGELEAIAGIFTGAGLDVTLLKDEQCTYNVIENFKDYGLVIIDTHGLPAEYITGTRVYFTNHHGVNFDQELGDTLRSQLGQTLGTDCSLKILTAKLGFSKKIGINFTIPFWNKKIVLTHDFNIHVTTNYINELPPMPNTIIFGDMCFSGYAIQDAAFTQQYPPSLGLLPMKTAWMNKNPISYYCFSYDDGTSTTVRTLFGGEMLDSLARRLATNKDSTGIAHLHDDGSEFIDLAFSFIKPFHFKHFGADDYSYSTCIDHFTDARDGHVYKAVCIGTQTWMAENLAYDTPGASCYNNDPANCAIYGKLYDFTTLMQGAAPSNSVPSHVQGVCPKGWHVPSDSEYIVMTNFLVGNAGNAGGMIKSTSSLWQGANVGATNSSGFSALPGGSGDPPNVNFRYIGQSAYFQTSSGLIAPTYIAANLWISNTYDNSFGGGLIGDVLGSCRCVKDP